MGGGIDLIDRREAASLLQWWLDAGVDMPAGEKAHDWLAPEADQETVAAAPTPKLVEMPGDLGNFWQWLATSDEFPLAERAARRIAPMGTARADIMLFAGIPGTADGEQPIGGDSWTLASRMLAAIGLAPEQAYVASLLPFALPGGSLADTGLKRCGEIARQHIRLAGPKRLVLFGDTATRALLGEGVIKTRGKIHEIEGVRTIATFAPRLLLTQPAHKARSWKDLLLLMEE